MVKVKEASTFAVNEDQTVESWLQHLKDKGYEHHREQIQYAFELVKLSGQEFAIETGETCFKHGLAMAEIVADLGMDLSSVLAALLFSSVQYAELSLDLIEEELGADIARLIKGVMRMNTLSMAPSLAKISQKKSQLDNWRKMLLAMADDVRVVLIKLADRLCVLRATAHLPETIRRQLAQEAMNVYAPLAHRLGIGAIKWELEDLAFRYLHPDDYKTIAKGLRAKRLERDRYVNWIVEQLQMHIKHLGMKHYSIYGRSKHIHSIYNKM
jgi:GTP pyrophosphokinase